MAKKSTQFTWRKNGPEQAFLRKLFRDGTVTKDAPGQDVYAEYMSVWPPKLSYHYYKSCVQLTLCNNRHAKGQLPKEVESCFGRI